MFKELNIVFAAGDENEATMVVTQNNDFKEKDVLNIYHGKEAVNLYRVLTGKKEFINPSRKGGEGSEYV